MPAPADATRPAPTGPPRLKQLVVTSTPTLPMTPTALRALVNVAQARNREAGLSSLLIHAPGYFLHYLEGPAAAVDAAYARIRADPRHHDLRLLVTGPIEHQVCADCAMASVPLDAAAWHALAQAPHPERVRDIWARHCAALTMGGADPGAATGA